jgi:redox-sensitive bicupin YhaK (pirin superfamily)
MTRPRYQDVAAAKIPVVELADGVEVHVIAGAVGGVQGAVTGIAADPQYLDVTVPAGVTATLPVTRGHAAFAYVFAGAGWFVADSGDDRRPVNASALVLFADGDQVRVMGADEMVRFLLVSGRPLGEPIARYGPFVMNTRAEIDQALRDLRAGTFVYQA